MTDRPVETESRETTRVIDEMRANDEGIPMTSPVRSVTAVFPCYNDEKTIARLVDDVYDVLAPLVEHVEVIVVNDGSADGSRHVLDTLALDRPWFRPIHHDRNGGYGAALRTGFTAARHDWIFYTDGDAQYDAREAADLVKHAADDVDIVQGYKIGRGDKWYRKVIGRVYHHVVRLLFRLHVRDTDCDFRLFRRAILVDRPLTASTGVICVELMHTMHKANARFVEVPVQHYFRPHGRSQYFRLPAVARSARQLVALWWTVVVRGR